MESIVERSFNNGYFIGMSGRPKKFDEATVLEAAMQLFWEQGYRSTSYEDLVKATGLARQSLYHSFGDKKSLFQKSLEHYSQTVTQQSLDLLTSKGSPLSNICRWLKRLKNKTTQHRFGCLLTNTAIELASQHAEFRNHVAHEARRIELTIGQTLKRAIDAGEVKPATDVGGMATYLFGAAQGLMVLGRSGASSARLDSYVQTALSTIETT